MKIILCFLIPVTLILAQCRKPRTNLTLKDLPPITQTGANTFGCLVNGQGFVPQPRSFTGDSPPGDTLSASLQFNIKDSTYRVTLQASDAANNPQRGILITIDTLALFSGTKVSFSASSHGLASAEWILNGLPYIVDFYKIVPPLTGELDLLKVDKTNQIIAATFHFDAIDAKGEQVQITQGRFDMHYSVYPNKKPYQSTL